MQADHSISDCSTDFCSFILRPQMEWHQLWTRKGLISTIVWSTLCSPEVLLLLTCNFIWDFLGHGFVYDAVLEAKFWASWVWVRYWAVCDSLPFWPASDHSTCLWWLAEPKDCVRVLLRLNLGKLSFCSSFKLIWVHVHVKSLMPLSPTLCRPLFQRYAETCFAAFGDRVKHWVTFNEIHMFSIKWRNIGCDDISGCGGGDSKTWAYTSAHHMLLSHAAAVDSYRTKFQVWKPQILNPKNPQRNKSTYANVLLNCLKCSRHTYNRVIM